MSKRVTTTNKMVSSSGFKSLGHKSGVCPTKRKIVAGRVERVEKVERKRKNRSQFRTVVPVVSTVKFSAKSKFDCLDDSDADSYPDLEMGLGSGVVAGIIVGGVVGDVACGGFGDDVGDDSCGGFGDDSCGGFGDDSCGGIEVETEEEEAARKALKKPGVPKKRWIDMDSDDEC